MQRVPLFLSYSKDDTGWLDLVSKHLSPLERNGQVEVWDDRKLRFSDSLGWEEILLGKLRQAGVIVILYSPSFVATDYCQKELKIALERKHHNEAKVFVIRIRPCNLQDEVAFFQICPSKGRAVSTEPSPDKALEEIVAEIKAELLPVRAAGHGGCPQNPGLRYLYNRVEQEDALYKLIETSPDDIKQRPLAFLLSGPAHEEHSAFHHRMLLDFLPKHLRQTANGDLRPMNLPDELREVPFKDRPRPGVGRR
jgi:hypothetical protein